MKNIGLLFINLISVQCFGALLFNAQPHIENIVQEKPVKRTQSAREYLLKICKDHYDDHMQRGLRSRRPLEASKFIQQLNEENGSLLEVLGYSDIIQYCDNNYRK